MPFNYHPYYQRSINYTTMTNLSYGQVRDIGVVSASCLTNNCYEEYYESLHSLKEKAFAMRVKDKELDESQKEEDQVYERWRAVFQQCLDENEQDPFEASIFRIYRLQIWSALALSIMGFVSHCLTFYLLYRIYQNLQHNETNSEFNKMLAAGTIFCRFLRIYCCYAGEIKLNEAGLKIYRLGANCLIKKSLRCSPLSNKNISSTMLSKLMHTDCECLLIYPSKIGFALENVFSMVIVSCLAVYVAGLPGLIGILLFLSYMAVRACFKKLINKVEKQINKHGNERIKSIIQMFNIIKLIKTNALESCYFNKIRSIRMQEVKQLKVKLLFEMIQNAFILIVKPTVVAIVFKLIVWRGDPFELAILFTVTSCVNLFNIQAVLNAHAYIDMIQISLKNMEVFMKEEEMDYSHLAIHRKSNASPAVAIKHGFFEWDASKKDKEAEDNPQDNQTVFSLKNINLQVKRGEFIALVGGYGSGKSSFANCLLGEMKKKGDPRVTINGTVAYASQVPWIMNDTIKNNILFGRDYDEKRYREAIKYASLEPDLDLFANGDLTVIGKRGSTLSGGQKARVSLARALYSDADIYILDDILSAVDAHVGAFLFSMTIMNYLKQKTVLLITHSLFYVSHCDRILIFEDGQIVESGTFLQLSSNPLFAKIQPTKLKASEDFHKVLNNKVQLTAQHKLQKREDTLEQEVGIWQSFKIYIERNSGIKFAIIMSLFIFVISAIVAYTQIMLNKWALSPNAKSNIYFYIQLLLNVVKFVLALLMTWVMHVSRIYQSLHDDMIRSLLFSPLSYFEKTPSDKIINRLSTHISMNDKIMTSEFGFMLANLQLTLSYLFSVIYVYIVMERYYHMVFLFVFSAITIFIFYEYFGIAMKINKLEREMLIPINSKYSEMIDGLTTIRAYDKVEFIVNEFWRNMNIFSLSTTIKSFIEAKLKLIIIGGPNLLIILQLFSVVFLDLSFSENTVFLIFSYFGFEDSLMRFYQGLAAYAPRLQSLGKCEQLTGLTPEPGYVGYLQHNWVEDEPFQKVYYDKQVFNRGQLVFKDYSLRYKPELDDVLKKLSFTVRPGEKIGIVGRTGSGKSTLMLGLLRIIEASQGRIEIDGLDISKLSLEELRSNINIILQDHFMYSGTVRENVDPTNVHTDKQVEDTLKMCGIWEDFQDREGVNTVVTEGGGNLSSGEKQLLNIARSLLNPKRIVLIDEATASIDIETDALIQKVIKKQFADRTVLTIAHRINTVLESDRIIVLKDGHIHEFDSPQNLLRRPDSLFAQLHKQSGKVKDQ